MRLDDLDPSSNVEDMGRGSGGFGGGGGGLGGLIGFLPLLLGRRMGCGTMLLLGAVVAFYLYSSGSLNLSEPTSSTGSGQSANGVACDTEAEMYSCRVLASTEQVWGPLFQQAGSTYRPAKLKFFTDSGPSACGQAQSAMGPFYCPADQSVYLDTAFFGEMSQRMGAKGDFAQAYVVAHEVGHHIQTLLGISDRVRAAQSRASQTEGNAIQVRMELQADCYAGVWAAKSGRMEPGDMEEGMTAANAIGDDTLMAQAGRRVSQENFTHGSSQQRMDALRRGLQSGDPAACEVYFQ